MSEPVRPGDVLEGYKVLEVKDEHRFRVRTSIGSSMEIIEMPVRLGKRSRRKVERQRRLLSWLRHPHIRLPVDMCPGPRGLLLINRRGSGEALERRLWRRPPSSAEALRWGMELCALLTHMHQHGLVLGRLSPSNLQLDSNGHLEISGFRLNPALSFEPSLPDDGPSNFEAPEGARTERSDVYIAGRLVEYLLAWAPATITGETRRHLQEALERATRVTPHERYQDCASFKSALGAVRHRLKQEAEARRGFPWKALGQGFAAAVLMVLLGGGMLLAWTRAEHFRNAAEWSTMGSALVGQAVWVTGHLEGTPSLRAPLSGMSALGYRSQIQVHSEREVWDPEEDGYAVKRSTRIFQDVSQVSGASLDGVPIQDGPVEIVGGLVPRPVTTQPPLEVGEKRLGVEGSERVLGPGDEVVIRGVMSAGRLIPFEIRPGSRWAWEASRLSAALPGLLLALLSLIGLGWVVRSIWRSAVPD